MVRRRRYRHLQGFPDAFLRKKELVLPESQVLLPDLIRERCSGRTGSGNCSVPERSLRRFVRDNHSRTDELEEMGLTVPQITKIFRALHDNAKLLFKGYRIITKPPAQWGLQK